MSFPSCQTRLLLCFFFIFEIDELIAAIHSDIEHANKRLDVPENEAFKSAQIFSKI